MNLIKAIAELDSDPDLQAARLLILISAFAKSNNGDVIGGLTKLAKLDFLLRYPVMLQRALDAKGKPTKNVMLEDHERLSVESEMVRYRFGPWDHRYREFLNILTAKQLVETKVEGRKVVISITDTGIKVAEKLISDPLFEDYGRRSALLKKHFDIQANTLMKFIYETFPEVISLRSNKVITL